MARPVRFTLPGLPHHVVQRAHRREPCFFEDADRECYLDLLREHSERQNCQIHAYVLMTNHVHLLVTPRQEGGVGRMMQGIGRTFVRKMNARLARNGTLWEGRYRACIVADERYLLACYRYIELNPVRAGMVQAPDRYRWSSYRGNALGRPDPLLTPHPAFVALGREPKARQEAYQSLVREQIPHQHLERIRRHIRTQKPLDRGGRNDLPAVRRTPRPDTSA